MRNRKQADNLIPWAEKLNEGDLAFIRRAVNLYGEAKVNAGEVLFLNRPYAVFCLLQMHEAVSASSEAEIRKAAKVIEKIGGNRDDNEEFEMFLKDYKVGKYSRNIGEREFEINTRINTKRNAGIQYQHFGNKYINPEVLVEHKIILVMVKKGLYKVRCAKEIVEEVKSLLFRRFC